MKDIFEYLADGLAIAVTCLIIVIPMSPKGFDAVVAYIVAALSFFWLHRKN